MSDASTRPSGFGFWFFALFFVALFLVFVVLVNRYYLGERAEALTVPAAMTAEERADLNLLTPAERKAQLEDLRNQARSAANTYGWIHKESGVVRLPVDRAIELTVKEVGDPAAPAASETNP